MTDDGWVWAMIPYLVAYAISAAYNHQKSPALLESRHGTVTHYQWPQLDYPRQNVIIAVGKIAGRTGYPQYLPAVSLVVW